MITSQSVAMLCSWELKAGIAYSIFGLNVRVAGDPSLTHAIPKLIIKHCTNQRLTYFTYTSKMAKMSRKKKI